MYKTPCNTPKKPEACTICNLERMVAEYNREKSLNLEQSSRLYAHILNSFIFKLSLL